jgi:tetratricopeptide (TPR) repeat protein
MDIRRNESCSAVLLSVLLAATVITVEGVSWVDIRTPIEVLATTSKLAPVITPAETQAVVDSLEKALAGCEDEDAASRIKYRIGVIYFRSHMLGESKSRFLQLLNDAKCPELVRVCSLNMLGQISRLQGQTKEALEAFKEMANLVEPHLLADGKSAASASTELWCSALFSRAEILEMEQDYTASIAEYNRLLKTLKKGRDRDICEQYGPLVNDRISQLHIRHGDIDKYTKAAEALIDDYPEYYRTPIVELEIECVKLLGSTSANRELLSGGFAGPAKLIALAGKSKNGTVLRHIRDRLDSLCEQHQNTNEGILLQYHYAWFLDALGEKDRAADVFTRMLSSDTPPTNIGAQKKAIIETVRAYARIQLAIIATERADYKEALLVLSGLQTHTNDSHISELSDSVIKSIEILKREVPRDENQAK